MAHSTYDVLVIGQVGLARLAAVDLVAVEVRVICESHDGRREAGL